jgi:biopolymer transport protein TolQ
MSGETTEIINLENLNLQQVINVPNVQHANTFDIASLIKLLINADLVSKGVVLILIIASIFSLAIILDKYFRYRFLYTKIKTFENNFWSGQSLEQLYERTKRSADNPMAAIFIAGFGELNKSEVRRVDANLKSGMILQAMNLVRNRELEKLEKSLTFLAIVGSYSPFIGLFGMVWGVIHSFQSIAASKNVSLAVVAPGMSEALLVTAIGIVVALPAAIFYNILSDKMNHIANRFDDFVSEIHIVLTREI